MLTHAPRHPAVWLTFDVRQERTAMFVLARASTYSALFIGLLLIFLPARVLSWTGVARPAALGPVEFTGIIVALGGAVVCLWCIFTFVFLGKGTPAPFDPPRRLVANGPYSFVRNPMYLGAGLALCGAAIFFHSLALFGYTLGFLITMHLFVVLHEEPALHRIFGADYAAYRARVRRWLPHV